MQKGRPIEIDRYGREAGTEILNVRLTRSQKEEIRFIANSLGITIGEYVRQCLFNKK